jgi:hypothetical protein
MKTKKSSLIALALLALGAVQAHASVLLSEGFDNVAGLTGAGWTVQNFSGPVTQTSTTWFQGNAGIFESQAGAPDSYLAANFLAADTGGDIELYMLAPDLLLTNGDTISFWTRTDCCTPGSGDDLLVGIWGLGSLFDINPGNADDGFPLDWTHYTVVVSGLSGPTVVKFGFEYFGPADRLNYIGIDSVEVNHVPEPGTLMLLGLGLAGLGFVRRRNGA